MAMFFKGLQWHRLVMLSWQRRRPSLALSPETTGRSTSAQLVDREALVDQALRPGVVGEVHAGQQGPAADDREVGSGRAALRPDPRELLAQGFLDDAAARVMGVGRDAPARSKPER